MGFKISTDAVLLKFFIDILFCVAVHKIIDTSFEFETPSLLCLQFNDTGDLAAYPRTEANDAAEAAELGVDVLFAPPVSGRSFFTAGIILAIMIVPIITSLSREVIDTTPANEKEAAYGLGATRWEAIRMARESTAT